MIDADSDSHGAGSDGSPQPLHDRVHELVDRLDDLEDTVESQNTRIEQLERENEDLGQRVDELERENEALRDRVDDLESSHDVVAQSLWELEDFVVGERNVGSEHIQPEYDILSRIGDIREEMVDVEDIDEVEEEVSEARHRYSQQAAMLQKRLTALDDEVGVDSMELVTEDDQISRLVQNGPEDVFPRVHKKHRRARMVLVNASDWGRTISDELGRRVVFKTSTVKPLLEAKEGRSFASSEIDRIFAAVEELGEQTTRKVKKDKSNEGEHRLSVWGLDDAR
jgi:chromosome segregation ATPase